MSDHEQERLEDYLDIEQYLESLRAQRKGVLPEGLTVERALVYRMAARLHSAIPENAEPRAEFLEELHRTLQKQAHEQGNGLLEEVQPSREEVRRKRGMRVSRRNLLTGGAAAAASLAIGTAAGVAYEKSQVGEKSAAVSVPAPTPTSVETNWKQPLVGEGVKTVWQKVVGLAELGNDAYAFHSEAVVGYVMKSDEQDAASEGGAIVAFSAACTHMGCLVQWQGKERSFNCPCHGGKFDEYGQPAKKSAIQYLRALPRINTKVGEDGYIYVEVPVKNV